MGTAVCLTLQYIASRVDQCLTSYYVRYCPRAAERTETFDTFLKIFPYTVVAFEYRTNDPTVVFYRITKSPRFLSGRYAIPAPRFLRPE